MPMFKSIPDSAVAYYADFRSGTILDFTRVNTLAYYFPGTYNYQFGVTGIKLNNADMAVQTADTAALTLDGSIIVGMQAVVPITANKVLVGYRTNAGVNKGELSVNKTAISFYDGVTSSTYTATVPFGKRSVGVSWATGTTAKFYLDGVLFGAGTLNNASLALTDLFCVGRANADNSGLPGTYSWVVKTTRVLTSTEMSVLTSELQDRRFPTRSSSRFTCDLGVNSLAPNLIWAPCLNQPAINGIVTDVSPTGSNASIVGTTQPTFENDALGGGYRFNGANGFTATGTAFTKVNDFTVNLILSAKSTTGTQAIIAQQARWYIQSGGGGIYLSASGGGDAGPFASATIGKLLFLTLVIKGDNSVDGYVNGNFIVNYNFVGGGSISAGSGAFRLANNNNNYWFNGKIYRAEIYSKALSAAEVKNLFDASGIRSVGYQSQWGSPVSTAVRGGVANSQLESTGWRFGSTTPRYWVDVSTINGTVVKTMRCSTAGHLTLQTGETGQNPQEAAYGQWEWSFYKGAAGNLLEYYLVASTTGLWGAAGQNVYLAAIGVTGYIGLVRRSPGGASDAWIFLTGNGLISAGYWYSVKVTRTFAGVWAYYIKGGTYTNWTYIGGGTDNTYTSSSFRIIDNDAGDLISLGSADKQYCFTKQLMP
jgi:hypothetical protein